jgi:putative DNA primase/helicase
VASGTVSKGWKVDNTTDFNNTDVGNANRLAAKYSSVLRWVPDWRTWLHYDGIRWAKVSEDTVVGLAKQVLSDMKNEARVLESSKDTEDKGHSLGAWAYASERGYHIDRMVEYAKSDVLARPSDFDQQPWQFNALDCTIDLQTGLTHPHDPNDMITKVAGTAYDTGSDDGLFFRFIDEITGSDTELATYIQQVLGLSLTGDTSEKLIWFLNGDGDNGKTVLVEITGEVLGDYAEAGTTNDIIDHGKYSSAKPFGLVKLVGVRRATYAELSIGDKLNWNILKQISGSDTMSVEEKFRNPINTRMECKVMIFCNDLPTVEQVGESYWSRIRVIPFKQCFSDNRKECKEKDSRLIDKLRQHKPAILRWLVGGELLRREYGLVESKAVTDATTIYREESDILSEFLKEVTYKAHGVKTRSKKLYTAFEKWYREPGDYSALPLNESEFGKSLKAHGYQGKTIKGRAHYVGIALKLEYDSDYQRKFEEEHPEPEPVPAGIDPYDYDPD